MPTNTTDTDAGTISEVQDQTPPTGEPPITPPAASPPPSLAAVLPLREADAGPAVAAAAPAPASAAEPGDDDDDAEPSVIDVIRRDLVEARRTVRALSTDGHKFISGLPRLLSNTILASFIKFIDEFVAIWSDIDGRLELVERTIGLTPESRGMDGALQTLGILDDLTAVLVEWAKAAPQAQPLAAGGRPIDIRVLMGWLESARVGLQAAIEQQQLDAEDDEGPDAE